MVLLCLKIFVSLAPAATLRAAVTVGICLVRAVLLKITFDILAVPAVFVEMIRKPPDPLFVLRGHTTAVTCLYHQPENEICFSG